MNSWFKRYDIYNIQNIPLLREYYKRRVISPNREYGAQIYFEYDCKNSATYIDFTNKKRELLKRVKITPSGWSVICKSIGNIIWIDNSRIKIFDIQVCKNDRNADCNKKYYWEISINGEVEYTLSDNKNPHLLFTLGKKYYEGKKIIENKEKGINLIRQSANMNYKHAKNWLKRNLEKTE